MNGRESMHEINSGFWKNWTCFIFEIYLSAGQRRKHLQDKKLRALKQYLIHMSVPWTHSNTGVTIGL